MDVLSSAASQPTRVHQDSISYFYLPHDCGVEPCSCGPPLVKVAPLSFMYLRDHCALNFLQCLICESVPLLI